MEQEYIMTGLTAVERHGWNRVQIVGEDHMFMATTNYTWNSFKHLWPHLLLPSATVSKTNGNKNNPGKGSSVLFLERILQCPHKQGHLEKDYLRILLRGWLNHPLIEVNNNLKGSTLITNSFTRISLSSQQGSPRVENVPGYAPLAAAPGPFSLVGSAWLGTQEAKPPSLVVAVQFFKCTSTKHSLATVSFHGAPIILCPLPAPQPRGDQGFWALASFCASSPVNNYLLILLLCPSFEFI